LLVDRFGRTIKGLRISLTYDCNLDCFYCHREGCARGNRSMSAEEIAQTIERARELGIQEVKLTGGEPTLRKDLEEIVRNISRNMDVSMTTNATLLPAVVEKLAEAGLKRINVDLPTLDENRYQFITGRPLLSRALEGIREAVGVGLKPIKVNMVLLRGVNVDEVEKMLNFCAENGLILQLIEFLPFNDGLSHFWFDLRPIEKMLEERAIRIERREMHLRKRYLTPEGEVEIVRSLHNSEFCLHCTRLRLTPNGYLKPCLMRNDNLVDLLGALRTGDKEKVREAFFRAVQLREPYFCGTVREPNLFVGKG